MISSGGGSGGVSRPRWSVSSGDARGVEVEASHGGHSDAGALEGVPLAHDRAQAFEEQGRSGPAAAVVIVVVIVVVV